MGTVGKKILNYFSDIIFSREMVILFGIFLIFDSIYQITEGVIPEWGAYCFGNQGLPTWAIAIRYVGSWAMRFFGIFLGTGIIFFIEPVRKWLVRFFWYCLITVPFKHTFWGMFPACFVVYSQHRMLCSFRWFLWQNIILYDAFDVLCFSLTIWFFTKPKVMQYFKAQTWKDANITCYLCQKPEDKV